MNDNVSENESYQKHLKLLTLVKFSSPSTYFAVHDWCIFAQLLHALKKNIIVYQLNNITGLNWLGGFSALVQATRF